MSKIGKLLQMTEDEPVILTVRKSRYYGHLGACS